MNRIVKIAVLNLVLAGRLALPECRSGVE